MPKLFMVLVGCTPAGRHTEQHDVFFGIGESLAELVPAINDFWPEVKNKFHLDAWREVTHVNGYQVQVVEETGHPQPSPVKLFFLNLGGYKPGEFEEFHYKIIIAAADKAAAIRATKKTTFYRHTGFVTAPSHVDDKYGIDVDDAYEIKDILNPLQRERYRLVLTAETQGPQEDMIHLGYFKISSLR
jgi:hypothetical protein